MNTDIKIKVMIELTDGNIIANFVRCKIPISTITDIKQLSLAPIKIVGYK